MSLLKIPEFQLYLFSNTQSVIGGEKALLDAGVPCLIMPLPTALSASCGLAIKVAPEDSPQAAAVFRQADVTPAALYKGIREGHDTRFEPLPLVEGGAIDEK